MDDQQKMWDLYIQMLKKAGLYDPKDLPETLKETPDQIPDVSRWLAHE